MRLLFLAIAVSLMPQAMAQSLDAQLKDRIAQYVRWEAENIQHEENERLIDSEKQSREKWVAFAQHLIDQGDDETKKAFLRAEYALEISIAESNRIYGEGALDKAKAINDIAKYQALLDALQPVNEVDEAAE